jgi:hypothetical protein
MRGFPLLELADEPEPLRTYLNDGVLYGMVDEESGRPLAAVVVIGVDDGAVDLRAIAVAVDPTTVRITLGKVTFDP